MNRIPRVLGLNRTQDASFCVLDGDGTCIAVHKERLTRVKHAWGGLGDVSEVYAPLGVFQKPFDVIVECFSSDRERKRRERYLQELQDTARFLGVPAIEEISHHLAHAYSVLPMVQNRKAAVLVMDFQGSQRRLVTEPDTGWANEPAEHVEVTSLYMIEHRQVRSIDKVFWNLDRTNPVGLGAFYYLLTQVLFPGEGNDGKTMGLAPYADPFALGLPPLSVRGLHIGVPEPWRELLASHLPFQAVTSGVGDFDACARIAAAGQWAFEGALLELADHVHERLGTDILCLVGGTALNCVANGRLRREGPFRQVLVPPCPGDGGTAIGCAVYGHERILGNATSFTWAADYLGVQPELDALAAAVSRYPHLSVRESTDIGHATAELLANGKVCALFLGAAEFGPRALGHRSILADPRTPTMKDLINHEIKGRESFRPLAPMVLAEDADAFFEIAEESPHMLFAAVTRLEARGTIPAVVHVDGSARVQTVSDKDDEFLRALLQAFKKMTGIGVLLNTSFNGPGDPIVETIEQALACMAETRIDALIAPPFVVEKTGLVE